MSIVSIFSPCCRLISNQMCPLNLWHVQVRGVLIGLIESHGKIWWSYFFPIHLNFWCCLPGKIFLCVGFSLKIMDLHIHCSIQNKSYIKAFCIFISWFNGSNIYFDLLHCSKHIWGWTQFRTKLYLKMWIMLRCKSISTY